MTKNIKENTIAIDKKSDKKREKTNYDTTSRWRRHITVTARRAAQRKERKYSISAAATRTGT